MKFIKSLDKKIIIILVILIIFILIVTRLLICFKNEESVTFTFKDITNLEYGYTINDLLLEEINCDEECYYLDELLEYKIEESSEGIGNKDIHVVINYKGNTYEHDYYNILVSDTTSPVLILKADEDTLLIGSEINPVSYIESFSDNYDELEISDIEIDNKVEIDKAGDYEIIYSVSDSSDNKAEVTLTIHIVQTEEEVETAKSSSNNNNSSSGDTTSKTTSSSSSSSSSSNFKSAINSVSLSPLKTRNSSLDTKISSIISSETSGKTTNYDKVVALYDYVKNYLSYKTPAFNISEIGDLQDNYHYSYYDAQKVLYATYALDNKTGSCDSYAALLMILLRRVGFNAYMVSGYVKTTSGSVTGHSWVMVKANDTYYILDAQIEDSKGTSYTYFGKTASELNIYTYDLSSNINKFNSFKEIAPLTSTLSISGATSKSYSLTSYSDETVKETIKDMKVGDTINLTLTGNSGYTYIIRNGGEEIKSGTFSGSEVSTSYTFTSAGTNIMYVDIKNGQYVFGYYQLSYIVSDSSVVKITKLSYKKNNGYINGEITVTDGSAPYTYTAEITETDDADATITVSDNAFSINYQADKYYKVTVTVTDTLGSTATNSITINT